jgi:hemoglobin-like flavoprotein
MGAGEGTIETSLELVAERIGDPAALIYARLFAAFPDTEALFFRDLDGKIRGEMLAMAFECLLGEASYAQNLLRAERINHEGFGIDPEAFLNFFPIVREVCREALGPEWTGAVDRAWAERLDAIDRLIR